MNLFQPGYVLYHALLINAVALFFWNYNYFILMIFHYCVLLEEMEIFSISLTHYLVHLIRWINDIPLFDASCWLNEENGDFSNLIGLLSDASCPLH